MAVLDRVPVERITAEARQVDLGRTLLTLLAGLFFVIGWLVAQLVNVLVFALSWAYAAVRVGYIEGRSSGLARKGG